MAGTAGKNFLVKVSTTAGGAGSYTTVADINTCSMDRSGAMLDITAFGGSDISRIQGLKDCKYQLSGFHTPGDTNGQAAINTAYGAGSELWVQFLPNGTAGFKQQVMVSSYQVSSSVAGSNNLSITLEGTGAIATV